MDIKQEVEKIKGAHLLKDITQEELLTMLGCLRATVKDFDKGETVLTEGKIFTKFGLLIEGKLQVIQYDFFGNKAIISEIGPKQIFGETFSYINKIFPMNVEAVEKSKVLFLDADKLSTPCENSCDFHKQLVKNLLYIVSTKNANLVQKIEYMSQRTTKEKLLSFLRMQSIKTKSNHFVITYNRQALADYLGVERSAMSAELSKLQKEGIIKYDKNEFILLQD